MGQMPETAIFRRFGFLNAQNLLYMQAELVILEKHLRRVQAEDAESGSEVRSQYAEDWFYLSTATNDEGGNDEQWELMKEIRGKLREYNDTLLQQIKLAAVEPPGTFDMQYLQQYLESREMSDGILSGADRTLWGSIDKPDDRAKDLLSLLCRHSEDFFSKWVTEKVVTKLIKLRYGSESSRERDLRNYKDNKVLRWTFLFASVLASALPVVSIAILYCVHSLKARLGLIATFNVLLSFVLATFTSAKRAEVFAVAAAFAAVQVVFVQVGTEDTK
ncbi:uncharacterized protein LTHEOB_8511 [Neofusicoccum parvum]|nr:uncharacterized protein LTHEOB_8511 [Neofusicoccum parvum]